MSESAPPPILLPLATISPDAEWEVDKAFATPKPVEVDVGCGKGRFLLARAAAHPETNFLGVDRMRKRLLKVEKKARRAALQNIRLLQIEAGYLFERLLPARSVTACYIFFSDPWPKRRHHRRRLFSQAFLSSLHKVLVDGGGIHVATDHLDYYSEIYALFANDARFAQIETFVPAPEEQTQFELIFLEQEKKIGRCSFVTRHSG